MSPLRALLFRLLKVPPEPHVPMGDGGPVRVFRAGHRYYQYRLVVWVLRQLGTVLGILAGLFFFRAAAGDLPPLAFLVIEGFAVAGFLVQLPFTYALLRLDYDLRWYIVTDRSIRIREGVATVKEKTMTFANLQNITVQQGPLQRALGIADLKVRTAGGGEAEAGKGKGTGESMHEAYFRGVENAEEVRDVIRAGVRRHRDSGLGDPDEPAQLPAPAPEPAAAPALLLAAREMVAEARALREAAAAGR